MDPPTSTSNTQKIGVSPSPPQPSITTSSTNNKAINGGLSPLTARLNHPSQSLQSLHAGDSPSVHHNHNHNHNHLLPFHRILTPTLTPAPTVIQVQVFPVRSQSDSLSPLPPPVRHRRGAPPPARHGSTGAQQATQAAAQAHAQTPRPSPQPPGTGTVTSSRCRVAGTHTRTDSGSTEAAVPSVPGALLVGGGDDGGGEGGGERRGGDDGSAGRVGGGRLGGEGRSGV